VVVLDHTEECWDVCHFVHKTGLTYPQMVRELDAVRTRYPGVRLWCEANNAGASVIQHCPFPVKEWWTTAKTKSDMLYGVSALLEQDTLKIPAEGCERLIYELRIYAIPDAAIPQDAVIALARGLPVCATAPPRPR
jgi:hypothetical protein